MPESQEAPKIIPVPVKESTLNPEKLLGEKDTGAQALMLLGKRPPKEDESFILSDDEKKQIRESAENGIPKDHKEKINNASFNERTEYWENKKDIKPEDRMKKWEEGMDGFLKPIKEDTNKTAETFLKNILKKDGEDPSNVTISAKNIYDTFMKNGMGNIEFVGMGHTHPKGYGPIFSNVGGGDFGLDYSSEFEFRSGALFTANPCASNISFVGAPEMGLISAFEAKPEGVIEFHPINTSEQEVSPQKKEVIGKNEPEIETKDSEAKKIKKELFENAGNKNKKELALLIENVEKILDKEKEDGSGKLKDKISEIKNSEHGKEKFVDGSIVYLPDEGDVIFIGDTHGDPDATVSVIEQEKFIEAMEKGEKNKYLVFLGDYVDRGMGDVENIEQIIALKEKYPDNVILLRGNHEVKESSSSDEFLFSLLKKYGDQDALKSLVRINTSGENYFALVKDWKDKFKTDDPGKELYEKYNELFEKLPGVVVCSNGIVGVHGGIPNEDIKSLKELNDPKKLYEMRWNDPAEGMYTVERANSGRGDGVTAFDKAPFDRFMNTTDGKVMVRAHENNPGKTQFDNRLLTVFSTGKGGSMSHYGGKPVYAKFDLEKDIEKIGEDNIKELVYIKPDYEIKQDEKAT